MAIQINPNIYTGGNVRFDTGQNVAYYEKLKAKQQAKDDALNQYFNDLQGKINTAGVRQQDLFDPNVGQGINKDIEDWRNTWLANKDEIKRGGMAQQTYLQKFQDILRKIDQSKNRAKTELEIGKAKLEGKYDPDDDDLNVLNNIGLSIYNPQSYKNDGVSEYGIGDLSPAVPEFDADRQLKFWKSVTGDIKPTEKFDFSRAYTEKKTNRIIAPYVSSFLPEQLTSIAKNAANAVVEDRSARKYYNKLLKPENAPVLSELTPYFQSVFGKDNLINTVEEVAAADAIRRAVQQKKEEDKPLPNEEQRNINIMNRIAANKGSGQGAEGTITGNALDELPDRELAGGGRFEGGVVYNGDGSLYNGSVRMNYTELPASVISPLQSVKVTFSKKLPITAKIVDGQVVSIKQEGGNEISRQFMENAQKKIDTEPKGRQGMDFGRTNNPTPSPKPSSNEFSVEQLKKAGWTDEQIKIAVKAGKIKVKK